MCFYSQQTKDAKTLSNRFKAKVSPTTSVSSSYSVGFVHPQTPIIADSKPDEIQLFQWGLIQSWAKDKTIQQYTLNAKIESLAEKPSFKSSISKRCLVIANGFFEWQWLDSKGKRKQRYRIGIKDDLDDLFAFAGIYSEWADPTSGEIINTYSILTTETNALMAEIHNSKKRMPIILSPEQETAWLSGQDHTLFSHPTTHLSSLAF